MLANLFVVVYRIFLLVFLGLGVVVTVESAFNCTGWLFITLPILFVIAIFTFDGWNDVG